jgi:hypothetical protein
VGRRGRLARAAVVFLLSSAYLAAAFRIFERTFWTSGLGDWMDPYFINVLLEHWFYSAARLTDPSSPPMYFPVRNTLGYSHGLVLYAVIYTPLRLLLHPFQAYSLTLVVVMGAGVGCLYRLLRKYFRLTFLEALLLGAFFLTSPNVMNGGTGVWSQRASVFLVPPILLLLAGSLRMRRGASQAAVASGAGLMAGLLFVQDFYTAQFALLFVALFLVAALPIEGRRSPREWIAWAWSASPAYGPRVALAATAIAAAWTACVWMFGGGTVTILGVRIASQHWRRPAAATVLALLAFVALRGGFHPRTWSRAPVRWLAAVAFGAGVGLSILLWIYLPAYREHPAFPEDQLVNALKLADPTRWVDPAAFLDDVTAYDSLRSWILVIAAGVLAWSPRAGADRKARLYGAWLIMISVLVFVMPLRIGDFSVWRVVFERVPGFAQIRDPRRVVFLYELAVVLAVALILTRAAATSVLRIGVAATLGLLLVAPPHRVTFDYLRPNEVFDRWVAPPVDIDPSCDSFFIGPGSVAYTSRSDHKWTLYGIDAVFIALSHALPTLNGYSAWAPGDWDLLNPEEDVYAGRVHRWVERYALDGVCKLDIDARTMRPSALMHPTLGASGAARAQDRDRRAR